MEPYQIKMLNVLLRNLEKELKLRTLICEKYTIYANTIYGVSGVQKSNMERLIKVFNEAKNKEQNPFLWALEKRNCMVNYTDIFEPFPGTWEEEDFNFFWELVRYLHIYIEDCRQYLIRNPKRFQINRGDVEKKCLLRNGELKTILYYAENEHLSVKLKLNEKRMFGVYPNGKFNPDYIKTKRSPCDIIELFEP
jgi:hypothetical protein